MRIAKITGQGLRWIAALVLVLWGCIVAEHSVVTHARRETVNVLVQLQQMRGGRSIPVSQPLTRPVLGNNPEAKPVIG